AVIDEIRRIADDQIERRQPAKEIGPDDRYVCKTINLGVDPREAHGELIDVRQRNCSGVPNDPLDSDATHTGAAANVGYVFDLRTIDAFQRVLNQSHEAIGVW